MQQFTFDAATGERTWKDVPDTGVPLDIVNPEVSALRREYLDSTAQLCALAEMPYTGKLSNIDYRTALQRAAVHTQAGVIAATLVYCRARLYELEGDPWWDNIGNAL